LPTLFCFDDDEGYDYYDDDDNDGYDYYDCEFILDIPLCLLQ